MPDVMVREVVREDLTRTARFVARAADQAAGGGEGDGLTLDGYGAVFDAETVIDSWEGQFREVLAKGCFKRSLKAMTPKMQFDHGRHPLIGSIPIGTFDDGYPVEDDMGLRVVGRLTDNWLIQPVRDAIAAGAIDGMSFRFSVVREQWTMPDGKRLTDPRRIAELLWAPPEEGLLLRTIQEVKLSEVGPVTWPAYEQTSVGVRARQLEGVIDLARLHEPGTRRLLAQAVLMVDAADGEQNSTTARPRTTAVSPVDHARRAPVGTEQAPGEHRQPTRQDEPAGLRTGMDRWLSARRVVIEHTQRRA